MLPNRLIWSYWLASKNIFLCHCCQTRHLTKVCPKSCKTLVSPQDPVLWLAEHWETVPRMAARARAPSLCGPPVMAANTWTTATATVTQHPFTPSASARCRRLAQPPGTARLAPHPWRQPSVLGQRTRRRLRGRLWRLTFTASAPISTLELVQARQWLQE